MYTISAEELHSLVSRVMVAVGADNANAERVAQALVSSDIAGVDTHGVFHLPLYVADIKSGYILPSAKPEIIKETATTALIGGNWTFGFVAAKYALDLLVQKVRENNIAGVFRYRNDLHGLAGRVLERYVAWRTSLGLPYGDQCLLISRSHYHRLGGFSDFPIMEDIEFARRIGRRGLRVLPVLAVTSGVRYRGFGIFFRGLRNLSCLALYFIGLPPRLIAKIYG